MQRTAVKEMNSYKNFFELIVISLGEDEEGILERASKPLPREFMPNNRVVLEVSFSSAEATAYEEECFDISTDSLESNCKRIKLNSSLESLEIQSHVPGINLDERQDEGLPNNPESPDESMCSDVFVVEAPSDFEEYMTSSKVAEYLEKVHQKDSSTYFITPPGTPENLNFQPVSPLNDLEEERNTSGAAEIRTELP